MVSKGDKLLVGPKSAERLDQSRAHSWLGSGTDFPDVIVSPSEKGRDFPQTRSDNGSSTDYQSGM